MKSFRQYFEEEMEDSVDDTKAQRNTDGSSADDSMDDSADNSDMGLEGKEFKKRYAFNDYEDMKKYLTDTFGSLLDIEAMGDDKSFDDGKNSVVFSSLDKKTKEKFELTIVKAQNGRYILSEGKIVSSSQKDEKEKKNNE